MLLRQRGIIKLKQVFRVGPNIVMVMEYAKGGDLLSYLKREGKLSEDETRFFLLQIIDVVRYCHLRGIVHKNLKSQNIVFADAEHRVLKLIDFGISGIWKAGAQVETNRAGTLLYSPP